MMFVYLFIFLVVSISIFKSNILKLVIFLEFLYIVVIFLNLTYHSLTLDYIVCIMMFSTSESVMAFCLVMVFSKFFSVKDKVFFNFL